MASRARGPRRTSATSEMPCNVVVTVGVISALFLLASLLLIVTRNLVAEVLAGIILTWAIGGFAYCIAQARAH